MRVADTSGLYAAFAERDVHHRDALDALGDPEPIVVPSEILVETIDLIQYRMSHEKAQAAGSFLRALPHVQVRVGSAQLAKDAWETYADAGGKLSLADAWVVAWCLAEGASPLTFDREIRRRARR